MVSSLQLWAIPHHYALVFEKTNLHFLPVKNPVGIMPHPFTQVEVAAAAVGQAPVDGQMPVPEHKIIGLHALLHLAAAVLKQPLLVFTEPVAFGRRRSSPALFRKKSIV